MAAGYVHACYRSWTRKEHRLLRQRVGDEEGGEMRFSDATNYYFFAFAEDAGAPIFELAHNHDRRKPYDPGDGYSHVAFIVDDLEGTVAKLKKRGVEVALKPKTVEGHDYRIAFVKDPDGYRAELIERGTMKAGEVIQ